MLQTVTVTQGGQPVKNKPVSIVLSESGKEYSSFQGDTDAAGTVRFTYVPPYMRAAVVTLQASCSGCSNTATKQITVDACDVCEPTRGNPIQPATAEKIQREVDWKDEGVHPLSITRTYRSYGDGGGSGGKWFHDYHASIMGDENSKIVVLGDGRKAYFSLQGDQWVPRQPGDQLQKNGDGVWIYARLSDGRHWYIDAAGKLLRILDRNGWAYEMVYDQGGRLLSVTNNFGRKIQWNYSASTDAGSIELPDGQVLEYSYWPGGQLKGAFLGGIGRIYQYEMDGRPDLLTGIVDETGREMAKFSYGTDGRAMGTAHGDAGNYVVSYGVDWDTFIRDAGALTAEGATNSRWFSVAVAVKNPLGGNESWRYQGGDGNIRVSGMGDAYDGFLFAKRVFVPGTSLPLEEANFLGVSNHFSWNTERRLPLQTTYAAGTPDEKTVAMEWHPQWALPTKMTEPGRTTEYGYDDKGNRLTQTVTDRTVTPAVAKTWSWTYHPSGLVATATEPNGAVTRFDYDASGNLTQSTNAMGQVDAYTHDAAGRVLTHAAPTGLTSQYQYDARGRLTRLQRGDLVALYTYHPTGQLATATTPDGYEVSYAYDAAQRLTGWSDNRGASASYTLDGMGNRVNERIADAQGRAAWQLARSINSLNRVERVSVGGADSGPAATTTGFGYDANGDLVRSTETLDGVARNTTLALDALRRVKSITNAQNATATLAYDGQDAITKATDFKGVATSYTRDAQGNALQEATPDAGTLATTYDALGLPKSITDALGRATAITRDALGRPTQIVSSAAGGGASRTTVLRYDLAGAEYNAEGAPQASVGSLSEIQEAEVTTRYQRDLQGRVTRKTEILANGDTRTLGYRYVPAGSAGAGQVAAIIYPSGRQLQHQYDTTGQLTGLQWNGQPLLSSITWNPLGQPTAWQWSGGLGTAQAEQRSYTTAGQLASSRLLPQLVWDGAGRVARMQQRHALPGTGTLAQDVALTSVFTYDSAGRLTASAHSAPADLALPQGWGLGDTLGATASGYAWDANGNRTQVHHTSATGAGAATLERVFAQSAGSNRLQGYTERFTPAGGAVQTTQVAYSQDAAGALTKKGDTYLHYGVDGRIMKVGASADASDALAVGYVTNALGQRVLKRDARLSGQDHSATTQQTVYAEDGIGSTVLGQYGNRRSSDSGAPASEMDSTEVIWLPTAAGPMPVAAQINGRLYAIDADHLNTPRRLTNAQGQVVWQWLIAGFGEANPTTGATGYAQEGTASGRSYGEAVRFDLRYPGQVWDEETGLSYNLHRYYDAGTGRYVQADPIGLEGGWNRFGYAGGNPASYTDPTGQFAVVIPFIPAIVTGTDIAVGAGLGALGYGLDRMFAKPPKNAYDPNGPKAPGKPTEADGFKSPKGGDNWVPNPNPGKGGSSWGWQDAKGDVWCPTGQGGNAHGGPHWDVQTPGGDYRNVKPRR